MVDQNLPASPKAVCTRLSWTLMRFCFAESSIAHMCTSCFSKCIPTTNSVDGRDLAAPLLDADDTADEMTWWVSGSSFIPAGNTDIKCDPVVINMAYFKVNTEHDNSHLPQGQLIHAQAVERCVHRDVISPGLSGIPRQC